MRRHAERRPRKRTEWREVRALKLFARRVHDGKLHMAVGAGATVSGYVLDDGQDAAVHHAVNDGLAERCDDAETLEVIARTYREAGMLLDPHTAVGVAAAARVQLDDPATPVVVLLSAADLDRLAGAWDLPAVPP